MDWQKPLFSHKRMIGLGFLVLAAFLALGFALSLRDWRVREVLFQSQGFRFIYGAVFLLMAIVGLQWWLNTDGSWSLIVGLLVGAIGIAIINIIFNRYRDDLR